MKKIINLKVMIMLILMIVVSLSFADIKVIKGNAKGNTKSNAKIKPNQKKKKNYEVKNLPKETEKVIVEGKPYFHKNGVYYSEGKSGYKVVNAPYGVKVKHLPKGVRLIRHKEVNYYYFYNTYYMYDNKREVYIVIKTPEWADSNYSDDKLTLMNGSELIGKYMGGDRNDVFFLFNGEKNHYPLEEVISIEFAPAFYRE